MEVRHSTKYGGRGAEFPCPLQTHYPTRTTSMYSPNQKLSESHILEIFMEALSHRYDQLNHWPLVINSKSSSSSLPRGQEMGDKSSTINTHAQIFVWTYVFLSLWHKHKDFLNFGKTFDLIPYNSSQLPTFSWGYVPGKHGGRGGVLHLLHVALTGGAEALWVVHW